MVDLRRLRHVGVLELPHRARQLARRLREPLRSPPPTPPGPPPSWPVGGALPASPRELARLRRGWVSHGAAMSADSPWSHDPATGRRLPRGSAGWIDVLQLGFDPRPAWELHRLQHLALWAHLDPDDPTPARRAAAWLAAWPTGTGLPWTSALEAAFRLVSLVRVAQHHPHASWRQAVAEHAWWIARHPSRGSSLGNHRAGELAALTLAARALPDHPDAAAWRTQADGLPDVLDRLVLPDGGGAERSVAYLAVVLEWALLARACGQPGLDAALLRGVRFLRALMDDRGGLPRIGDDDQGRVIATTAGPEAGHARSVAGAAAAALGIEAPPGWTADLRTAALGIGPQTRPPAKVPRCRVFPDTGLTVLRSGQALVVFDHGPVGGAHLAAHGHADALSFWLHLGGRPVVVGRGTPTYAGDVAVRKAFRGAPSQSAVLVDGHSPSEPSSHPFLWTRRAQACRIATDADAGRAAGWHDGFAPWGVHHQRHLRLQPDALVIEDVLDGSGRHHVAVQLQLAPDNRVDVHGEVCDPDGRVLHIEAPDDLELTIVRGGADPAPGWHSPAYGQRVPAPTVVLQGVLRLPARLTTVLRLTRLLRSAEGVPDGRRAEPT